jgi:hypothetical protein
LPEKILDNYDNLRNVKLCQFKPHLYGFKEGNDALARITIMNYKSNQLVYQSKDIKLLESFSVHSVLPVLLISRYY